MESYFLIYIMYIIQILNPNEKQKILVMILWQIYILCSKQKFQFIKNMFYKVSFLLKHNTTWLSVPEVLIIIDRPGEQI